MPSLLGYCRDATEVGKAKCSLFYLKIVQTNGIDCITHCKRILITIFAAS